jgi:hypothetical protein
MGSGKFLTHLWRVGMELVISLLEVSKTLSELINLSSDFFLDVNRIVYIFASTNEQKSSRVIEKKENIP